MKPKRKKHGGKLPPTKERKFDLPADHPFAKLVCRFRAEAGNLLSGIPCADVVKQKLEDKAGGARMLLERAFRQCTSMDAADAAYLAFGAGEEWGRTHTLAQLADMVVTGEGATQGGGVNTKRRRDAVARAQQIEERIAELGAKGIYRTRAIGMIHNKEFGYSEPSALIRALRKAKAKEMTHPVRH